MAADYYKVLGIDRKAGEKEVRTAFRKLARKYHPDVNHGQADASERFKEINEAHEVLSNPESRRLYDRYGENWRDAQRGGGQFQSGRRWQTQTVDPEAYQEFFGGRSGGFFDSFFRESRGNRRQGPQQPSVSGAARGDHTGRGVSWHYPRPPGHRAVGMRQLRWLGHHQQPDMPGMPGTGLLLPAGPRRGLHPGGRRYRFTCARIARRAAGGPCRHRATACALRAQGRRSLDGGLRGRCTRPSSARRSWCRQSPVRSR